VPVLDESVPDESALPGPFAVPSPLVLGVLAEPLDDWSGLLGAAGIVCPVGPVESPVVEPDCVPVAWPVADEPASGLVAADEPLFGSVAVSASAATDDTSAPAAKNGTSLLLMVIDVSPCCVSGTVRPAARIPIIHWYDGEAKSTFLAAA